MAGELFNGAGKTDICIRVEDRNVFIGECKFYNGPRSVTRAIDQLLGYVVWRDTKAALLLFVRGGNFTDVVEKAVEVSPITHSASAGPPPPTLPAVATSCSRAPMTRIAPSFSRSCRSS